MKDKKYLARIITKEILWYQLFKVSKRVNGVLIDEEQIHIGFKGVQEPFVRYGEEAQEIFEGLEKMFKEWVTE